MKTIIVSLLLINSACSPTVNRVDYRTAYYIEDQDYGLVIRKESKYIRFQVKLINNTIMGTVALKKQ